MKVAKEGPCRRFPAITSIGISQWPELQAYSGTNKTKTTIIKDCRCTEMQETKLIQVASTWNRSSILRRFEFKPVVDNDEGPSPKSLVYKLEVTNR